MLNIDGRGDPPVWIHIQPEVRFLLSVPRDWAIGRQERYPYPEKRPGQKFM